MLSVQCMVSLYIVWLLGQFSVLRVNHSRRCYGSFRAQFIANEYHLLYRNCNHFSNECSLALLSKPVPSYINRLVIFGQV